MRILLILFATMFLLGTGSGLSQEISAKSAPTFDEGTDNENSTSADASCSMEDQNAIPAYTNYDAANYDTYLASWKLYKVSNTLVGRHFAPNWNTTQRLEAVHRHPVDIFFITPCGPSTLNRIQENYYTAPWNFTSPVGFGIGLRVNF